MVRALLLGAVGMAKSSSPARWRRAAPVALLVLCMAYYGNKYAPSAKPKHICERAADGTTCVTTMDFAKETTADNAMFVSVGFHPLKFARMMKSIIAFAGTTSKETVAVTDARKLKESTSKTYRKRGFALLNMRSEVTDYHSSEGQRAYEQELRVLLKKLHPRAKSITFPETSFRFQRGKFQFRTGQTKEVTVGKAHLDMHPNWTSRVDFEERDDFRADDGSVPDLILGVWKPVNMVNPICDNPLAVLDAATFSTEDMSRFRLTIDKNGEQLKIDSVNPHNNPKHRWFYYDKMTTDDVLVFTHYTDGRLWANPHTSIFFPDCEGSQPRATVETRAVLRF